jgi:alpha-L-arabinofuranosidase
MAAPIAITIDGSAPRVAVSPELYGIFYEEINHAGEGGLYAEMVQNRDFEASTPEPGWTIDGDFAVSPVGWRIAKWFKTDTPAWSYVAEGAAKGSMQLDSVNPLNERNPHSLKLTVTEIGDRCGIANSGFWGMNVKKNEWYDATFFARGENDRGIGLIFSLETEDGKKVCARTTLPEIGRGGIGRPVEGSQWSQYTVSLHANDSDPHCRLVISPIEPGTLWFDCVSLFPRKTFKNRPNGLRPDLAQMLVDLHPGFLRFPGGCVVEGVTEHNRIRWRDSIGDISQRQGGFDLWGYYATYGLGFHEFLQLAEELGAAPMYVINSGMTCQSNSRRPAQVASDEDLPRYVQDSLDALEYAMGPTTSELGAMRAANGHPQPFNIKYVEIGNENRGPDYQKHYKIFYDAIKAKWPQVITIADTRMPDMPIEFVDDHFYVNPARFFNMASYYDKTDRNAFKIYVGEYAVNNGVGAGNLLGALSEAVFMLNMEKNSDVVKMCSYAPLFENVNDRRWAVNLIRFDSSRVVGRSSYQVQKLFGANKPDYVLKTEVFEAPRDLTIPLVAPATRPATQPTPVQALYALGGLDEKQHEVVIKIVNPLPSKTLAAIAVRGFGATGNKAKVLTLGNPDPTAENTLDQPNLIVPVESEMTITGSDFSYECPANSLSVLRVHVD